MIRVGVSTIVACVLLLAGCGSADPRDAVVAAMEQRLAAGERGIEPADAVHADELLARVGLLTAMAADAGGGAGCFRIRIETPPDGGTPVTLTIVQLADIGGWTGAERERFGRALIDAVREVLPTHLLIVALRDADVYHGVGVAQSPGGFDWRSGATPAELLSAG